MSELKDTCRVCLSKGFYSSIFDTPNSIMISTKLMSLAKVQIQPDDGLPNTICSDCVVKLDKCIEFVKQCETSDLKLRTSILEDGNCFKQSFINDSLEADDFTLNNEDISLSSKSELIIDSNTNTSVGLNPTFSDESELMKKVEVKTEEEYHSVFNSPSSKNRKSQKEQCFTCGKVMSSRFRLKTHLRTHTGERPYSCPHCHKKFSLAQNLKVHIRIHTGERPLQCTVCGATFAHSAGLTTHKRKHTGQTPYMCTLCPRSFRTIGHLQYHIRRHTGEKNFECDTCNRAFITRSDLKQHLLIHSGHKPHVCCVCGHRFTRASHLRRHTIHTHNGHKPFECVQCPAKFAQKCDYERHMKRHIVNANVEDN